MTYRSEWRTDSGKLRVGAAGIVWLSALSGPLRDAFRAVKEFEMPP